MPENYLFISYKSEENPFTLKLAASLKNRGVNVWVDRLDGGIETGDLWTAELDKALKGCSGLIAVLTPEYFTSQVCLDELDFAYREKRPILPILLRKVENQTMPFWLPGRQWIDFTSWVDDAAFAAQFEVLTRRLEREQRGAIGNAPSLEIQYLNTLIAELESQQGVENYIALAGESEVARGNPRMEKRVDPSLALLLGESKLGRGTELKREPIADIHEAVAQHPKFVLIGDPGAGKTTTLRRLVLETARERLVWNNPHPPTSSSLREEGKRTPEIPLLVYLPRWPDGIGIEEFICAQWQEQTGLGGDVLRELRDGRIRLYLDGLNEMGGTGAEKARKLHGWLNDTMNMPQYAIIKCRKDDYDDYLDLKLPTVLVEPLKDEKIREFAEKYLEDEEKAAGFCEKVFPSEAITWREKWSGQKHSLIHLARNPYLLAALLLIYGEGGDLPRNAGALSQKLVMVLWDREKRRKTPNWMSLDKMQTAFGQLAFDMIDTDQSVDVSITYARDILGSNELLKIAKSAGFVSVNGEQVRFSHQLMLEYFAAIGLRNAELSEVLHEPYFGGFADYRMATKWDQTVIALCGIEDANDVVMRVCEIDPFLGVICLLSGIEAVEETYEFVVDGLLGLLLDPVIWEIDEDAPEVYVDPVDGDQIDMTHEIEWGRHNRIMFQEVAHNLESLGKEIVPLLSKQLRSHEPYAQGVIVEVLERFGIPEALETVRKWREEQNE